MPRRPQRGAGWPASNILVHRRHEAIGRENDQRMEFVLGTEWMITPIVRDVEGMLGEAAAAGRRRR